MTVRMRQTPPTRPAPPPGPIRTVALVGGTHGDERTGVALARRWRAEPERIHRPGLEVSALVANEAAVAAGRRHLGLDLNRAFAAAALDRPPSPDLPPEASLARRLNERLGPKGPASRTDLLVDFHSACSPMGLNITITGEDPFLLRLAARVIETLAAADPPLLVRCYRFPLEDDDAPYLPTIARRGVGVEVGPVLVNTLDAHAFFATERLAMAILDAAAAYERDAPEGWSMAGPPIPLTIHTQTDVARFPVDEAGEHAAMLHPTRLAGTYAPLAPGAPLFVDFEGRVTAYSGEAGLVTTFVNEPAYAQERIALCLARREAWMV